MKSRDEMKMHVASFRDSVKDTGRQLGECRDEVQAVKKETQTEVVSAQLCGFSTGYRL